MPRYRRYFFGVMAVVATLWFVAATTLYAYFTGHANRAQMQEIAAQVAARAEVALDLLLIAQTDLMIEGHESCTPEARMALRRAVYRVGSLTDMYLIAENEECSANDGLSPPAPSAAERATWLSGPKTALTFGLMRDADGQQVLGVAWTFDEGYAYLAALEPDALLFDMAPAALREHLRIKLCRGDGAAFASFPPGAATPPSGGAEEEFSVRSRRFPLMATVSVDAAALANWRAAPPPAARTLMLGSGLLVGLLFALAVVRRPDAALEAFDRALAGGEIVPHFQPILDLDTGRIVGAEVLARWIKPNGERISPAAFIPLIEQNGRAEALLRTMMRRAGRSLGERIATIDDFRLSFNATPQQFLDAGFPERVSDICLAVGLRPDQTTIEITERQSLASPTEAAVAVRQLASYGVRTAIDDVGSGHNGLAAIQKLGAQSIKIDKFFIDGVAQDPRARVMVDMLVAVARKFEMKVVAEGVETEAQAQALREAKVDLAQGYLYSAPAPAKAFIAMLDADADAADASVQASAKGAA